MGVGVVVSPEDPRLQDLHDTGQQWEVQEESQGRPSVDGAAETRDLQPDQQFFGINACM